MFVCFLDDVADLFISIPVLTFLVINPRREKKHTHTHGTKKFISQLTFFHFWFGDMAEAKRIISHTQVLNKIKVH